MADPREGSLERAKQILDEVTSTLLDIRLNTPAEAFDDDAAFMEVKSRVGAQSDQIDLARAMAGPDLAFVDAEVFPAQFLYDSVDRDLLTGKLPRSPDDPVGLPDKDPDLLAQQTMRADAAEAEAEEATNGYEEVSDGENPDGDTQGG